MRAKADIAYYESLCYIVAMDVTIRNVDETAYRALKARAALDGKTVGEVLNEALKAFLGRPDQSIKQPGILQSFQPELFPPGNERLSEQIDRIVYGV